MVWNHFEDREYMIFYKIFYVIHAYIINSIIPLFSCCRTTIRDCVIDINGCIGSFFFDIAGFIHLQATA